MRTRWVAPALAAVALLLLLLAGPAVRLGLWDFGTGFSLLRWAAYLGLVSMAAALATLDVVVTAVEYGHGKRIGVLSDYTFAVRDGERLVNIGKAYSGLTDAEIAEMTKWFLEHKVDDHGFRLIVEPKIVLEVAFNNMMRSERHNSGFALRFPRIVRIRHDKLPEDADTIERVREIYAAQKN